jgi:hypothetical protein
MFEVTEEKVRHELMKELQEWSRFDFPFSITSIDLENQEITVKIGYHVVEEDEYIGFPTY